MGAAIVAEEGGVDDEEVGGEIELDDDASASSFLGNGSRLKASGCDAIRNARRRFSPVSASVRWDSRCRINLRIALLAA
jgi:hypothetical protein